MTRLITTHSLTLQPDEASSYFFSFFKIFLVALHSMWDLSSLTRDQTLVPCIGSAES